MGHQGDQLVVADFDELLAGGDLVDLAFVLDLDLDGFADCLFFHPREERLDNTELDVGFEQTEAHFPQRGVDALFSQLCEAGEAIAGLTKTFGNGVEHGSRHS